MLEFDISNPVTFGCAITEAILLSIWVGVSLIDYRYTKDYISDLSKNKRPSNLKVFVNSFYHILCTNKPIYIRYEL